VPVRETWEAMQELVRDGLVKNIGVSNFTVPLLMDLLSYADIPPAVNQVEMHPYLTQEPLLQYCLMHKVAVTAFSPFGGSSYIALNMATNEQRVLVDPVVESIAKEIEKTPAQVLLRWGLQRGYAVIPKSTQKSRIEENLRVFNFTLKDDHMSRISSLNKNLRFNDPGKFCIGMGGFAPIYD